MNFRETELSKAPFVEAVDQFIKLMSQDGRGVLIGAGCSKCAGLPLTSELTNSILENPSTNDSTKDVLKALVSEYTGLYNHSRASHKHPNQTSFEVKQFIVRL